MRPNNVGRPNNVKTNTHKSPNNYVCVNAHTHTRTHAHTHTRTHAHTHTRRDGNFWLSRDWTFSWTSETLVVKSRLITSNEEFWTLAGSDGLPRADQVVDGFDSVRLKSLFHVLSLIVSQIESDLRNPNFQFFFVRPEMLKMKTLSTKQNLTFYGHKTFFFLTLGDELNSKKLQQSSSLLVLRLSKQSLTSWTLEEEKNIIMMFSFIVRWLMFKIRAVVQCNQMAFYVRGNKMENAFSFFNVFPRPKTLLKLEYWS